MISQSDGPRNHSFICDASNILNLCASRIVALVGLRRPFIGDEACERKMELHACVF